MNLRQIGAPRAIQAPAKINLFLEVFGRRDDGYHELETLLVPVRLYDSLGFSAVSACQDGSAGPLELHISTSGGQSILRPPEELPTDRTNLVIRALELLREETGCRLGAVVDLVKRIPIAAGLGGGSSDAAATLRLANRGWNLGFNDLQLSELGAKLGSDVPFFLAHGPAICRGRGEKVEPLAAVQSLDVIILKPPPGLGTAEVYRALDGAARCETADLTNLVTALHGRDLAEIGRRLTNRLQAVATNLCPWIERVRAAFAQLDFLGHQLSGSGTAYFGICRHAQHARRLATILRKRQLGLVCATRSCL